MGRLSESPSVLSQPGDVCRSCMPFWTSRGKDPQRLIAVDSKVTDKKQIPVVICPWCDGDRILGMNDVEES